MLAVDWPDGDLGAAAGVSDKVRDGGEGDQGTTADPGPTRAPLGPQLHQTGGQHQVGPQHLVGLWRTAMKRMKVRLNSYYNQW